MNTMYLVSVIERGEDEYELFTDFRLFTSRSKAEEYFNHNLEDFQNEKYGYDFDYESQQNWHCIFAWNGDANNWEIRLTELTPE